LTERTCSCKSWELTGLSYSHVIAGMREERLNPMNFMHDCYSIKYFKITYSHTLRPINWDDVWETGPGEVITTLYFKPKKKTTCKFKRNLKQGKA